ncbi:hypothetical protein [Bradyrhizobium sp. 170]|uniref:hypothetical protein n=1 Tax=Bradyrhizobium sp. 170 TaxID=2782641 RepID=UPI001FFF51AD|nr:hypothetical protein [Bradyrhizobium sp. 170]UPK03122.1 hypothetical protein IVB05_37195 [Bradyrhizobium sp. 170]
MLINGFIISRQKNNGLYVVRHADRSIATIVTNVRAALAYARSHRSNKSLNETPAKAAEVVIKQTPERKALLNREDIKAAQAAEKKYGIKAKPRTIKADRGKRNVIGH